MRNLARYRIAVAVVAVPVLLGWAWSTTRAHAPAATTAEMGAFGAAQDQPPREPAPRIYFSAPVNSEVATTWDKLQQKVPMHFVAETALSDVLKAIKSATSGEDDPGLQFYVDPVGLQEVDKTMTSPVSIDLEGVPLTTTLELVLKQLNLGYHVQKDGLVVITSLESVDHNVDPTLLILDELRALRQEVQQLRTARMGGMGASSAPASGGGMR